MDKNLPARCRLKWAGWYVAFWVVLGVLGAVELFIVQEKWDKPITWEVAFRRAFKEMFAYAVCTLGALWLARRLWLERGRKARWVFLHLLGGVVFSVSIVVFVSWLQAGEISVQTGKILTFSYLFEKFMFSHFISNLLKYWVFVLVHLGWRYYRSLREREREADALAAELVQARLQALRMQINPHFLFNTLNSISALIHQNPADADRMIVRLSELLRRTLDQGDTQEVPLREEIEFLKIYLEIEQVRFQERLSVGFNIEPGALELLVPHLILQPLVENAIRHGIEPREQPGRIEITARFVNGDTLELIVRDNGNGLPETGGAKSREGIGLANVRSRLAHLYGTAHEFQIGPADGGGVEVRVRIPCCVMPRGKGPRVVVLSAVGLDSTGQALTPAVSAKKCC
jgi:signal transduction histidine kinase